MTLKDLYFVNSDWGADTVLTVKIRSVGMGGLL